MNNRECEDGVSSIIFVRFVIFVILPHTQMLIFCRYLARGLHVSPIVQEGGAGEQRRKRVFTPFQIESASGNKF